MSLTLTEHAAKKIISLIQEDPEAAFFRVMVSGGGCSGFQYTFLLETTAQKDDQVFEIQDTKIVVDEASLPFLEGIQIDYIEDLMGASFQVKNPNATASCGCGNSFSI